MTVRGYRYEVFAQLLHKIDGQLLREDQPYPHDPKALLEVLRRVADGQLLSPEEHWCSVTVSTRDTLASLLALQNDQFLAAESTCQAFRQELAAYAETRHNRPTLPYEARIGVPRIPVGMPWNGLETHLRSRGFEPAYLEESCAYLAVNRAVHEHECIVCLDGFAARGKQVYFFFKGEGPMRIHHIAEIGSEHTNSEPRYRCFARQPAAPAVDRQR